MNRPDTDRDFAPGGPLDFFRSILRLNHELERTSTRLLRELGISAQQRLIVRGIGKSPGLPPRELAAQLHLDSGTISAALRRLEAKGILERRPDAHDRRRVTIGLTERGRALDRPTARTIESAVERLLDTVDPSDIESAKRVLDELIALLDSDSTESERDSGVT